MYALFCCLNNVYSSRFLFVFSCVIGSDILHRFFVYGLQKTTSYLMKFLQVEESYTREALLAEERERDLGERLERAEKQLISSSSSLKDTK